MSVSLTASDHRNAYSTHEHGAATRLVYTKPAPGVVVVDQKRLLILP